jgi:hypothetical protein
MKMSYLPALLTFMLMPAAPLTAEAADHADSTHAANDPIADLADLYAFVDPPCVASGGSGCEADPIELIVALTLNPAASAADQFSEDVVYHFYFENDAGIKNQVDCSFSADQVVSCAGFGSLSAEAPVGQVGVNGDMRVYAGLRDDPMFFDLPAFEAFQQIGIAAYDGTGVDSLAGANVLAIVIGIKITAMPAGATVDHNLNKIWAASERIGGAGINGGITGSWYNPEQNGQGWVVEVVDSGAAEPSFLSFFYGYDNDGGQLWLITGASVIDGNTAVADVYLTSGTGFGGDYDPGSFVLGDVVGNVLFEFDDCDSGTVTFTSANTALLADFSNDIQRISNIAGLDCSLLAGGQVDRAGRPFISGFIPEDMRDAYNANSNPDSWVAAYRDTLLAGFQAFALADGNPAWNGFYTAEQWADIFADDRVQIDIKKAQSVDYLSIELSQLVPQDWNDSAGRALDYDVHETFWNVMITSFDPFIDDGLTGNDLPFLSGFPFLAEPH